MPGGRLPFAGAGHTGLPTRTDRRRTRRRWEHETWHSRSPRHDLTRHCSTSRWKPPLDTCPEEHLAALPRGISRHVVRFVKLSGRVLAVKEIKADIAAREYQMLRMLGRLDLPCVVPFGVVSGREAPDGSPLDACLITRHLQFSLPYRALFSQSLARTPRPG